MKLMQPVQRTGVHVAIIMDGNGRWASRRGLPRAAGHRAGVAAVRRTVEQALNRGVTRLTLYAFSSDNWRRPATEVQGIFWLLRAFLRLEAASLLRRDVRLEVIGRRDRLHSAVLHEIRKAESLTSSARRLHLCIAIDYSSRNCIADAAVEATAALSAEEVLSPDGFRSAIEQALLLGGREVDLLIRTGGEKRLSDFLLWESAYAELLFSDRMWPEFDEADFDAALDEFFRRERRFGALPAAAPLSAASTA